MTEEWNNNHACPPRSESLRKGEVGMAIQGISSGEHTEEPKNGARRTAEYAFLIPGNASER